jgi:hypothetical protein
MATKKKTSVKASTPVSRARSSQHERAIVERAEDERARTSASTNESERARAASSVSGRARVGTRSVRESRRDLRRRIDLRELNEAYHHFFFHYTATSLLVVEGSQFRPQDDDNALDDLVKQIKTMGRGTRYYVPRTGLR